MASNRSRVFDFIKDQPKNDEGWLMKTGRDIAEALQMEPSMVFQIVGSLRHHGKIETMKDGHTVVGVRLLEPGERPKPQPRKTADAPISFARVTGRVDTPETDRYLSARQRLADLQQDPAMSQFLAASPELAAQPIYEEAAALKQALADALRRADDLNAKFREEHSMRLAEERELEYLRKINNKELREGLQSAGVVHGD